MNSIYYLLKYIYHFLFTPFYSLGWRVGFSSGVTIKNSKFISIGKNVYLGKNSYLHVPDEHIGYETNAPKIIIEDKVTVGFNTKINAARLIHIKKDVLISPGCYITDHNHKYDDVTLSIRYQGIDSVEPIIIEKGAWIGSTVTICSGVRIGKNSVVGANSVVTKDIPDFAVAVGAPAKVIKKYDSISQKWKNVK